MCSVPDLAEEERARAVNGINDGLPCVDLLLRPDARDLRVLLSRGGDPRGLGDEEAAPCGSLRVGLAACSTLPRAAAASSGRSGSV